MNISSIFRNQNIFIIKFIIVGIFGNILNYLVFLTCFKFLGINYLISGIIGFVSPLPILFILNRNWTFKSNVKTTKMNLYIFYKFIRFVSAFLFSVYCFRIYWDTKNIFAVNRQLSSATMNFLISKYIIFEKIKSNLIFWINHFEKYFLDLIRF